MQVVILAKKRRLQMTKIAYLLMAHRDPQQIKRLVDSLADSGDFFIHIDKKVDITPFNNLLASYSSVHFINKRIRVNWAGWSMTAVYLELLDAAFNNPNRYDRFVLLTGQDYPIMTNNAILNEFENHKNTEYVMAYKISTSTLPTDKNKVLKRWFFENPFDNNFLRRCWASAMYHIFTQHFPRKTILIPLNGVWVEPYFGQMLSAFTRTGAELLLKTYHYDIEYNKVMKHVHASVEEYWQTIIFNSELRKNTIQNGEEHEVWKHFGFAPLHYHTYYDKCSEFDENDYQKIINSGYMFFRKVVPGKSDKLMDMIDEYRANR